MSDERSPPGRMAPNLTRLAFLFLVPTSLSLLLLASVYGFYFGELWIGLILFASAYLGLSLGHWVVKLAASPPRFSQSDLTRSPAPERQDEPER